MSKFFSPLAIAGALLSPPFLGAYPAQAFQLVTFVSGKGVDTGTCASPASPCRSFQFAISQTSPFGEVKALDPAHYGGMVITKSISITGVEGASINRISGDAITINAGLNDKINISHLILDGVSTATNGIVLNSGGSLTITHCTVRNFKVDGIRIKPAAGITKFLISNTLASGNGSIGVDVLPQGLTRGTIDHVTAIDNKYGINVDARGFLPAFVIIVDSIASDNASDGVAIGGAIVLVRETVASNNGISGVNLVNGLVTLEQSAGTNAGGGCSVFSGDGVVRSAGNNRFENFCGGDPLVIGTN